MDRNQLEQLGEKLREIGHKRRQLAEKILQEVEDGDNPASKSLYQELSSISDQAIEVMLQQKAMFDQEVKNL